MDERCFISTRGSHWMNGQEPGPCEGQLVRAHLIPKQVIRKAFPKGAVRDDGKWERINVAKLGREAHDNLDLRSVKEMQEDERCWVPMCGGMVGIGGHHGLFDGHRLSLDRRELPEALEEFAAETGLDWWLDRTYGESRVEVAPE